jgi:DNA-binding NarL/FixJ family response regulator
MVISARTAETHIQHIMGKLGFTARSQIAAWSAVRGTAAAPGALREPTRAADRDT